MRRSLKKELRRATNMAPTHTWVYCKISSVVCKVCHLRLTKSQRMFYTFGGGTADAAPTCPEQVNLNQVRDVQES